jgi:hypothetical protein
VNWSNYQLIATIGPLSTTGNDKWENGLQLGEIMGYGGGLIGIMLEPLSNSPTDAYPCFSADNVPNGVSLNSVIPNFSAFAVSGVGDFMQNLWIRTNFAKSGELVKLEPVTTQLNVTLSDDIRNMRIINYMGQMVYEQNIVSQNALVINTSAYKPGAYLLQFITESGETLTRRVVISK